jgi:hypothetical protein
VGWAFISAGEDGIGLAEAGDDEFGGGKFDAEACGGLRNGDVVFFNNADEFESVLRYHPMVPVPVSWRTALRLLFVFSIRSWDSQIIIYFMQIARDLPQLEISSFFIDSLFTMLARFLVLALLHLHPPPSLLIL